MNAPLWITSMKYGLYAQMIAGAAVFVLGIVVKLFGNKARFPSVLFPVSALSSVIAVVLFILNFVMMPPRDGYFLTYLILQVIPLGIVDLFAVYVLLFLVFRGRILPYEDHVRFLNFICGCYLVILLAIHHKALRVYLYVVLNS